MPRCPYCGQNLLEPVDRYCTNCQRELPISVRQPVETSGATEESIPKKPFNLKEFSIVAAVCTVIGYLIVFFPIFPNGYLSLIGLFLSIIGEFSLVGAVFVLMFRSTRLARMRTKGVIVYRRSLKPTLLGGFSFWLAELVTNPISTPHEAFSLNNIAPALVGSFLIALFVSWYYIYYYDRIPTSSPVSKSLTVSFIGLGILAFLGIIVNPHQSFSSYLVNLLRDILSFLALGFVVGYSYKRFNQGELAIPISRVQPMKRRTTIYYVLIVMVIVIGIAVGIFYINSLQPASFAASDIHFATTSGTIHVIANITNPSQPSIVQVNAAIDGMDDGVCGYGIQTNQTMMCNFSGTSGGVPLLSCSQLPQAENYTLTLNAYFGNSKTVIQTYTVYRSQLGC